MGTVLDVVLPNDIDDPGTPSGGNTYDRRVCHGLTALGWTVYEHPVTGAWPEPGPAERADLAHRLAALPSGALVLVDGLIASAVPELMVAHAARLRLVVLVHMPFGNGSELAAAAGVITTSAWTRTYLLERYGLAADRVHAAPPGVDPAAQAQVLATGSRLLCVAAVTPGKGHDVLLDALSRLGDLAWTCVCVGSLTRDPAFVDRLWRRPYDRVTFIGPATGDELDARYGAADLLVLPSRGETYGMVVTEALARGIPVLASDVHGLPEALGRDPAGRRPGLLVPPGDSAALAAALRRWLTEPGLRELCTDAAVARRTTLTDWSQTSRLVAKALSAAASKVGAGR